MNVAEMTFRTLEPPQHAVPQHVRAARGFVESQRYELLGRLCEAAASRQANLLTVLLGRVELLEDAEFAPASDELNRLREAAESAVDLTRSVLNCCSASRDTDLATSVARAADLLASALPPNVRLARVLEPIGRIALPVAGLSQAVLNLLYNAAETVGGAGEIHLRLRRITPDRGRPLGCASGLEGSGYEISIQDSGDGIAETALDRLGQPGYTTKSGHSGMGIYVAAHLVERLGGTIEFASFHNRGTLARILLPATGQSAGSAA